jgi:Na+/H+ antiporter NhaD/arsenite permease-like protein
MVMEKEQGKVVDDPIGRLFNKIGITGIASAILTIIFGTAIIIIDFEWEHFKLFIGLYLLIVGLVNLGGYVYSMYSRVKRQKTYIETETIAMK